MSKANNLVVVSLATDELPDSDRVALWREHYCQAAFGVEIAPENGTPFRACVSSITIPGLQLMHGNMSAAVITRTAAYVEDGISDLALFINRSGTASVHARGRDVTLQHGDAVLMSSADVTTLRRLTSGSSTSLRLSRSILSSLVPNLEDTLMSRIPEHDNAIRMLDGYLSRLQVGALMATPELRQVVVSHVYDLVALALGAARDPEESGKVRGVRAVRLERAKAFIIENINRMDLVRAVAAHVGVGARYLPETVRRGRQHLLQILAGKAARAGTPHAFRADILPSGGEYDCLRCRVWRSIVFPSQLPETLRHHSIGGQARGSRNFVGASVIARHRLHVRQAASVSLLRPQSSS